MFGNPTVINEPKGRKYKSRSVRVTMSSDHPVVQIWKSDTDKLSTFTATPSSKRRLYELLNNVCDDVNMDYLEEYWHDALGRYAYSTVEFSPIGKKFNRVDRVFFDSAGPVTICRLNHKEWESERMYEFISMASRRRLVEAINNRGSRVFYDIAMKGDHRIVVCAIVRSNHGGVTLGQYRK